MSDKSKLSVLSGRPEIQDYAQGTARDATSAIADFLAPTVEVTRHTGKFKKYDDETRFTIPETFRGLGGSATRLVFDRTDADFNCAPHALDTPIDDIEVEEAEGEDLLKEAADDSAFIGALAHEKRVLDLATSVSAVSSRGNWSSDSVDPVDEINEQIVAVTLAAGGGGMMQVGIVVDPNSVRLFFKNAKTKSYFPGIEAIAPTLENMAKLLMSKTEARIAWLSANTAARGKAATKAFMLNANCLIFARNANPTRRDPSFMKTFRLRNRWMKPGITRLGDDRGDLVKMDWSADVQIANAAAGVRLAIT